MDIEEMSVDEVRQALTKIKNGKYAGTGNIPVKLITYGPNTLLKRAVDIFNDCLG